jgi:DNA (cytosine-5)-methyltransferase 1
MKKYKILNLYACLGGNRYKWDDVAKEAEIEIEVTAVELDEELARLYQERFPNDKVIVSDAHQYLLDHYKEFDFIWTSPPCPTHSRARGWNTKVETMYPDMKLYEEIILLQTVSKGEDKRFKGKFVVENVIPYYNPLIPSQKRGRHLYWANFIIPNLHHRQSPKIGSGNNEVKNWCKFHDYNFRNYKGKQSTQKIARNLVDYEAGKTILQTALNIQKKENINQLDIFDL